MALTRREFMKLSAAGAAMAAGAPARAAGAKAGGRLVVIGGGFGGATAAKYVHMWSEGGIDVTLIEPNPVFVSCPVSNLVLSGDRTLADITAGYEGLTRRGIRVIRDAAVAVDHDKRSVRLAGGDSVGYDRLVVSPGIEFLWDTVPGLTPEIAQTRIFHAWKAGPQTLALRQQLADMKDGGVFALCIPRAPYRCSPGPYERASMVASYLKRFKPKSKVLILDANDEVQSKKALFMAAWKELYGGIVEYRTNQAIASLDPASRTVKFLYSPESVTADVLNVVPGQAAGAIARQAGLVTTNNRWCDIDWRTMESRAQPGIHVLGDATLAAPAMPKSGHITTQHAKVAAAAIVSLMAGEAPLPPPLITNTCYSFVDHDSAIHVASVHAYDEKDKTYKIVSGTYGVSVARNEAEAVYAAAWGRNILADALG